MTAATNRLDQARAIDRTVSLERLREALDERGVAAAIVTATPNMMWLSGFGGAGRVVVTADRLVVVTDPRYAERASEELVTAGLAADVEIARTQADVAATLAGLLTGRGDVGAEGNRLSYDDYRRLEESLPLVSVSGLIEGLRRRKQPGEVDRMRLAAQAAALALADVAPGLCGSTEREVAAELDRSMQAHGADGPGYDTIVASGPTNSARPHHAAGHRVIVEGDTVIIDVGAELDGYRSDMTRSFVIGQPTAEQSRRHRAVVEAQADGRAAARIGAVASDIDRACRQRLAADGLDGLLIHGVGHGVGLEIHEPPIIGASTRDELCDGEVITVEPGVYEVGVGGVRIEDLGVVTDTGFEVLTVAPYGLTA